jgi:hypothetical protein
VLGTSEALGAPLLAGTPGLVSRSRGADIAFRVPGTGGTRVSLDLFDLRGAHVARVLEGERYPGTYRVAWPWEGRGGARLAAGVYALRFSGEGFAAAQRVVVLP